MFWHSGVPFSVLSTPYSADGNGIVQGSGPQFASVVPGVPLYAHRSVPGVTQPGTIQWLNPDAFLSAVDPSTGQCYGGDDPQHCQFGDLGRNALRGPDFFWSDFYLTKWFPLTESVKLRGRSPVLQCVQPSEFCASKHGTGRNSRKACHPDWVWRAHVHYISTNRLARRRFGRRQQPQNDCVSDTTRILRSLPNTLLGIWAGRFPVQPDSPGHQVLNVLRIGRFPKGDVWLRTYHGQTGSELL